MVRFLIDTTVSKRDIYGNCYHYDVITATKTGNSLVVRPTWGSDGGNTKALCRKAGLDWSEIRYTERVIHIREFKRSEPDAGVYEHEVTPEMVLALES